MTNDGRVFQLGEDGGLAKEAFDVVDTSAHHLKCNVSGCREVARAPDRPHPAFAGQLLNLEPARNYVTGLHAASIPGTEVSVYGAGVRPISPETRR